MRVVGHLDLDHNEIQNVLVDVRPTETDINNIPGQEGQIVYLVSTKKLYLCIQSSPSVLWIVVSSGLSSVFTQAVASSSWSINHILGTSNVVVEIYDNSNNVIIPDDIDVVDADNITVSFGTAVTGKAVIIGLDGGTTLQISAERDKVMTIPATLFVDTGTARWYPSWNVEIVSVYASVDEEPTGSNIEFDINKNGTSILNSALTIPDGTNTSTVMTSFADNLVNNGDYVTIDVDQIGSNAAGAYAQIRIIYKALSF